MKARIASLFRPLLRQRSTRVLLAVIAVGLLIGIFARVFWLSYPNATVFDEVYFPSFAQKYLHRQYVFDVHPPFGKFIMAVGIWLFGNNGIGWRIMPLLFGLASIWLVGYLWYTYTKDRLASLFVAFLIGIDGILIAYSRVGLMDGILFFFMFATILAILKSKDKSILLGMSTLLGLTVSIKWVGLAIIVPLCYLSLRRKKFGEFLLGIWWAALVYLVVVGFGQWLSHAPDVLEGIAQWNREAWDYHRALTDTHPWSSPWWGWPLLTRPVLFIYDAAGDQAAQVMTTLGNPLVWWASGLAVIGSIGHLIRERFVRKVSIVDHPLVLPLLGWAACFLPWALVHRVVFLYHYMPAYGFALLCLAYWLARWFRKDPWLVVAICVVFVIVTLYFIPFMVGWWPLSLVAIKQHLWLTSWLY